MSTIAVNAITDASGGTTASINGYTPSASNMTGRNRIINGDMRIDQRNAGAAITVNSGSAYIYGVDRWAGLGVTSGGVFTMQQSSEAPTGFVSSTVLTVTTNSTPSSSHVYIFRQAVEGLNFSDLKWGTADAKPVTISFWVKSSLTGVMGGSVFSNVDNSAYPFTYSISSANTWEKIEVQVSAPTSGSFATNNTNALNVIPITLGAGAGTKTTANTWNSSALIGATGATDIISTSGATFYITGVQLEVGSSASEFEHRLYGQELALCQRYFISYGGTAIYERMATAINNATTSAIAMFTLPVEMRAAPTFGYSAVGNFGIYNGSSVIAVTSFSGDTPSTKVTTVSAGVASGLTTNAMTQFLANNTTSARATWSAEL